MSNKGIYFVASGVAELRDKGMPDISDKPGYIIVKTMVSSVSAGTERANLIGDPSKSAGTMRFPCQLGYSLSGVVVKVGDEVTKVKVGDRVACRWTTHSLYNAIDQNLAEIIPDNVSFEDAALTISQHFLWRRSENAVLSLLSRQSLWDLACSEYLRSRS